MYAMLLHESLPVAEHFLVALFNDDLSGLSDEDYTLLQKWSEDLPDEAYFEVVKEDEDADSYLSFQRDSVTGTLATCALINIYAPVTVH